MVFPNGNCGDTFGPWSAKRGDGQIGLYITDEKIIPGIQKIVQITNLNSTTSACDDSDSDSDSYESDFKEEDSENREDSDYFDEGDVIEEKMKEQLNHFWSWIAVGKEKGYSFACIVDKGFRDVKEKWESLGLTVIMPESIKYYSKKEKEERKERGEPTAEKQLSTQEANLSRLCTKTRWAIEAWHGIVKTWKRMSSKQRLNFLTIEHKILRIIAACLNKYRKPLLERKDSDLELAHKMKLLSLIEQNPLHELMFSTKSGLSTTKRKLFQDKDAVNFEDVSPESFPKFSLDYIEKNVALGKYQLKQQMAYVRAHMERNDGKYTIQICHENRSLFRVLLQSKHQRTKDYKIYIKLNDDQTKVECIACTCPSGLRTIGACVHGGSVVYFLGFGRYNPQKPSPNLSKQLSGVKKKKDSQTPMESEGSINVVEIQEKKRRRTVTEDE